MRVSPTRYCSTDELVRYQGCDGAAVDEAMDGDNPRDQLVDLIVARLAESDPSGAAASAQQAERAAREQALRAELKEMRPSALQKRALSEGCDGAAVDEAMDDDSPKAALIDLLMRGASGAGPAGELQQGGATRRQPRGRSELETMKMSALRKKVASLVDDETLAEAEDSDNPRASMVDLVLLMGAEGAATQPPVVAAPAAAAMAPAAAPATVTMPPPLARRAHHGGRIGAPQGGQGGHASRSTRCTSNPAAAAGRGEGGGAAAAGAPAPPLHRASSRSRVASASPSPSPSPSSRLAPDTMASPRHKGHAALPPTSSSPPLDAAAIPEGLLGAKHAMLSYSWGKQLETQEQVIRVKDGLTRRGVNCWMDIDGGMSQDIYDSMANGVENAAVLVCFMNPEYQESENCQLELKFAKQQGCPIVPVMLCGDNTWKASGWLGIVTAGSLWTPLDMDEFEASVDRIVTQIRAVVPMEMLNADSTSASNEVKAELERLRMELEAANSRSTPLLVAQQQQHEDYTNPLARIPPHVPALPANFRSTEAIRTLRRYLLETELDYDAETVQRVGFFGMGGIGKTVTSSAIIRDEAVRRHFDKIVYLALGQAPVITKIRSHFHQQITGVSAKVDWTEEQLEDQIRSACSGRRILLYLDDLWEDSHACSMDLCDPSSGSAVLISTRIRRLCGKCSVEVKPPTEEEATAILMNAAGLPINSPAPVDAPEICRLCGFLPLSLAMAGRLIADLGIGSDWRGVAEILQNELRGHANASSEQRMIRSSLAALGSSRESDNVRALFKLFALVPEDTVAPLEVLSIMFNAAQRPHSSAGSGTGQAKLGPEQPTPRTRTTSLLYIRKWLKILIDRSLVLGTVDRPQLHDLVLDYVTALHSEDELRELHIAIVDAFCDHRTKTEAGTVGWSRSHRGDAATNYVTHEVHHHVRHARAGGASDAAILSWATDHVQDCISYAAAGELGEDRLAAAAAEAEAVNDYYASACRWDLAAYVRKLLLGKRDSDAATMRLHAVRAVQRIATDAEGNELHGRCDRQQLETLRGLPRVVLAAPVAAEVAAATISVEIGLDISRDCAERQAACMGVFALGFRNGAAAIEVLGKFYDKGIAAVHAPFYTSELSGRDGAALAAAWQSSFWLLHEIGTKGETAALRGAAERQILTPLGKSARLDCTRARYAEFLPIMLELLEHDDIALASTAANCAIWPLASTSAALCAPVLVAVREFPDAMLALLHRIDGTRQLRRPAAWWKARSEAVHLDSVCLIALSCGIAFRVGLSPTLPANNAAWEELLAESIHVCKMNKEAELSAQPQMCHNSFVSALLIVLGAAREQSRHKSLLESGVVNALLWTTAHDSVWIGVGLADYSAAATVALIGRNEGGLTLTRETVDTALNVVHDCWDTASTHWLVKSRAKYPVKRLVGKVQSVVDMVIADANKPCVLEHPTAIDDLLKGLLLDDSHPRRTQDGAGKLQEICALALQNLALSDVGKGPLRSHSSVITSLRVVASAEGGMTEKARQYAAGALFELDEVARQKAKDAAVSAKAAAQTDDGEAAEHVMLSYNWDHQNVIKRINAALKGRGYAVWIDIEKMQGSTVEAMADAVEDAAVVCYGISAAYKESVNCRMEAQYAFQQQTDMVPLMLEEGYRAKGWLGMILGMRLWYGFYGTTLASAEAFEGKMEELCRELGKRGLRNATP